jgi:hypothetical protein
MGGYITFDGQIARLCKKCNPSPRKTTAAFQADTYPQLYGYLIWCNHFENKWYAIPRDQVMVFFHTREKAEKVISAYDFPTLIQKVK